ncbi:hypothetical protein ACOSP7_010613 [Xanthoceras sorbifolium]
MHKQEIHNHWRCFEIVQNQANMSSTKGTEEVNEQGATETKVETTDYRLSAGETEAKPVKVGVVHLTRKDNPGTGGGILTGAADAVVKTVESAKDAISGNRKDNNNNNNNK